MNHCFESVGVPCIECVDVVVDGMEFAEPLLLGPPDGPLPPPLPKPPLVDVPPPALPTPMPPPLLPAPLLLALPLPPMPVPFGPPQTLLFDEPLPVLLPPLPLGPPTLSGVDTPLLADTWPSAMAIGLGDESGDEDVNEEICGD